MEIPIPEYRMNDEQLKDYIDNQLSRPYDVLGNEPLCRFAETIKSCAHALMNHTECKLKDILSPLALS